VIFRRAFTLIEMVVALVLGTLLMAAITSALRRSLIELKAHVEDPQPAHATLLIEQFGRDLANARQLAQGPNRLDLVGFIHRDPRSMIATLRPAHVRYEIRRRGSCNLLVRIQSVVVNGVVMESSTEPVAAQVQTLAVSSDIVGAMIEADRLGQSNPELPTNFYGNRIPASVRVVLIHERGHTVMDHTYRRLGDGT
jgi:prepilin-type N-terminal cleavage/methylation domain-containing protein